MALLFSLTNKSKPISPEGKQAAVGRIADKIKDLSGTVLKRILLIPPDATRIHSDAGLLTRLLYQHFHRHTSVEIIPALGTHAPMSRAELTRMFGPEIPADAFLVHNWKESVSDVGTVPSEKISELSAGRFTLPVDVSVNRKLFSGYDAVISVGQVVPHEVIGMANYTKNICIGLGGPDIINKSHFFGAVCGMESIMGRADTPVRRLINDCFTEFLGELPVFFLMTVMEGTGAGSEMRGIFLSDQGNEGFQAAADLSREINICCLKKPLEKAVVYLDPAQYTSTWLGNKAIYRLRMAIKNEGELIVLGPGIKRFGENDEQDRLIRKYGYKGTPHVLSMVEKNRDLQGCLSAAAHLIHGSSEDRFRITYCPGPGMAKEDIEKAGFAYMPYEEAVKKYNPSEMETGWNELKNGETVYFVSNPGAGLWALRNHF